MKLNEQYVACAVRTNISCISRKLRARSTRYTLTVLAFPTPIRSLSQVGCILCTTTMLVLATNTIDKINAWLCRRASGAWNAPYRLRICIFGVRKMRVL